MPAEILAYREDIIYLAGQHIELVAWAGGLAILVGIPMGGGAVPPGLSKRLRTRPCSSSICGTTIPTLAVMALSMSLLGIGLLPSIFGLWAATLPPYRAQHLYRPSKPSLRISSKRRAAWGMTPKQVFRRVELPNALFVIFAGLRTALAICVGTAPLAFLIGAGGLGELIFTGIALDELPMMLAGAIPTAASGSPHRSFRRHNSNITWCREGINPLRRCGSLKEQGREE
jgi:osmoprotectant transport system permease protein